MSAAHRYYAMYGGGRRNYIKQGAAAFAPASDQAAAQVFTDQSAAANSTHDAVLTMNMVGK